jgi:tRNA A37 methylthiotransferase MiaB
MLNVENPSGKGPLYEQGDLPAPIYFTSAACMSLYAEALSFANEDPQKIADCPEEANTIVILCCQVTDLAILNDLRIAERLAAENPKATVLIAGCLARRFDVPLPSNVLRCDHIRSNYQIIKDRNLVHYEKPFWVKDFEETSRARATGAEMKDGNLFRNQYPLRIGVGCNKNCTYCTIRYTRGKAYDLSIRDPRLIMEFLNFDDVLLIADSPGVQQIKDWYHLAMAVKKPFSIRNVEPQVAVEVAPLLRRLSENSLLRIFHSPVQTDNPEVLLDMRRSIDNTLSVIKDLVPKLRKNRVIAATNIITDYKGFPNPSDEIYETFDYVSWNPYWDGKWDRSVAEERWKHYFGG